MKPLNDNKDMELIKDKELGGERPLFGIKDTRLENVTITEGESGIKCCKNIEADNCRFVGKYPWWHVDGSVITNCLFEPGSRSAIWYSNDMTMRDTVINAPKLFREMKNLTLENVVINDADETFWRVRNIRIKNVKLHDGTYPFMFCDDVYADGLESDSKYVFQYCKTWSCTTPKSPQRTRSGSAKTLRFTTRNLTASILHGTPRTCVSCVAISRASSLCATPRAWCSRIAPLMPPATVPSKTLT